MDWQRVRVNLDPATPLELRVEREGRNQTLRLPLTSDQFVALPGPRPGLIVFRLAQVITLGLAILVAVRRRTQPSALMGALLLASIATLSFVLPMRLAVFWQVASARARPAALVYRLRSAPRWARLLFAFFATFPRRTWPHRRLGVAMIPAVIVVGWSVYAVYQITRVPGMPTGVPDWTVWVFVVNVAYAIGAIGLLVSHRRAAESLTDQRRISVLGVGVAIGVVAGAAAVAGYWRNPGVDFFATRTLTVLSLVFLAVPASFAYAILRHRLFDLSLIVRQGVRYALARRLFAALIPALGALLLADVLLHRSEPLLAGLQSRWWWYTLVGAALIVARSRRERWLKSLDRRFFRERYDAQRLLKNIAEQISRASSFDAIAPLVVKQIDEALHPEFVDVLKHVPGETVFTPVTGGTPAHVSEPLPSSFTVIGLLSVLGAASGAVAGRHGVGASTSCRRGTRAAHRARHRAAGAHRQPGLGRQARRTARAGPAPVGGAVQRGGSRPVGDDRARAGAVARSAVDGCGTGRPGGMRELRAMLRRHDGQCVHDSQRLTPVRGARVLNGRYRLDRRLGRGGMGAVYAAVDEALERPVAVKLIRDDLVGSVDLNTRFRHEARAAAGFAHPHVVRVYDFGVDRDARAFLVMELLEGQTLRQRLGQHVPMDRLEVLGILRGVCSAISAAHTQGLVHRDLKPENIFLQRHDNGVVPKVLDFGLAKAFGAQWPHDRAKGTDAGVLVGTLEVHGAGAGGRGRGEPGVGHLGARRDHARDADRPPPVPTKRRLRPGRRNHDQSRAGRGAGRVAGAGHDAIVRSAFRAAGASSKRRARLSSRLRAGPVMCPEPRAAGSRRRSGAWSAPPAPAPTRGRARHSPRSVRIYWPPLYGYLRRHGHDREEAEDLVQGFFARLLERHDVGTADPSRGRFRSFLLTALKRYAINEHDRATSAKRGGHMPPLSLDFDEAERDVARASNRRHSRARLQSPVGGYQPRSRPAATTR